MSEQDLESVIEAAGLCVDYGYTVGGIFVDDGAVRIYDPEDHSVIGEGTSLESAYLSCSETIEYR